MNKAELSGVCRQMRRDIINMTANAGSGHPGGSLSAVELVASVFYNHMRIDPKNPHWADRDRFVLSKGHAAPCYYAVLAELGFISRDEFKNFRQLHSILQGHPDCKKVPWCGRLHRLPGSGLLHCRGYGAGRQACRARTPRCIRCWATASVRRARSGRPSCPLPTISWTT